MAARGQRAVQIALRAGNRSPAEDLAARHSARNPSVPTPHGIAAHTAALVNSDNALLERSVRILRAGPAPYTSQPPSPTSGARC
ncbi:hypothetical protein [Streptomyces sp. NPDC002785]|uniref:hypothetical protein n=1 Tax=Streptomyces sp. NPDC002785 TaxID=3154543 RepID=UPI003319AC8C